MVRTQVLTTYKVFTTWVNHTWPDYLPMLVNTSPYYSHKLVYTSPDYLPELVTSDLTIYRSEWTPHLSTSPDYLPERVNTSPEHPEILHHLLAQVMVDPVDFLLFKQSCQVIRQLVGTLQVFTEWFLHHNAGPFISVNIKWPSCQESPHYKKKANGPKLSILPVVLLKFFNTFQIFLI